MLPKSAFDKIQGNVSKPSFFKSLSPGDNWKSKSMRMIPEEFVKGMVGPEHTMVFTTRWENSWQMWLKRENQGLFIIEEDWDEFVDDNLLGPNDTLCIIHQDKMNFGVRIFKKDGKEIMSVPLEEEAESAPLNSTPRNSYQETPHASASQFLANGGTDDRARQSCGTVKNPERYLRNPKNPYFVRKLSKKQDVLYVAKSVIQKYGLKFGPPNSAMTYILPGGKEEAAFTRIYSGNYAFSNWAGLCRRQNLKAGDSVVCELECSGGVVTAVRLHFVK